jgi:hypothetical protein
MNFLTAQQDYYRQEAEAIAEVINRRDPVVVHVPKYEVTRDDEGKLIDSKPIDGGEFWTDNYGVPSGHITRTHPCGKYRPCVHAIEIPRQCAMFSSDWVLGLGWQPTLYKQQFIAARRSDIVVVGFDVVGPLDHCANHPTVLPDSNRWTYKMFPMIFDDRPDEVFPRAWLGIWND